MSIPRPFPAWLLIGVIILCAVCFQESFARSQKKYWVYFRDKEPSASPLQTIVKGSQEYDRAMLVLTPRALSRRARVVPSGSIVSHADLPISQTYLDLLADAGIIIHQQSRWLNAVSVVVNDDQLPTLSRLPFVERIAPVMGFRNRYETATTSPAPELSKATKLNYGPSETQVRFINVPLLHEIGVTGKDVIVGMLDTGFRWRVHESLSTRTVIAERDFIFNDNNTANQIGDASGQDSHGTNTLSTLGGYKPGQLIGPAFDASFLLGKTEDIRSETPIEEDNWVAAIEWMEAQGVDVVSSSLGYNDFDPVGSSPGDYTWLNGSFDGRTTVTARAAVMAARLGVLVCDAMGNEGNGDGVSGTMLTPADADSIISVGAVGFDRFLAGFSSTGPTNDARIKPDVVAPGIGVYCASTASATSYIYNNGTSLATPLAAGAAALVLSARPELTAIQVRDALRSTADTIDAASFPAHPNNFTGWGLVNALRAALSFGPIFSNVPVISVVDTMSIVSIAVASMSGVNPDSVILHFAVGAGSMYTEVPMTLDSAMINSTSGRYVVTIPHQSYDTLIRFFIDVRDSSGLAYRSPAEVTGNIWELRYGVSGVGASPVVPATYVLYANYPNPFNPVTTIQYDQSRREHVTLTVYDLLGRRVQTLVDGVEDAGYKKTVRFDASSLASGLYVYRIATQSFSATRKMMLVR